MIRAVIEPLVFAEGTNTVGITCTSGEDYLVFDRIEVSYPRGFEAEGNRLGLRHAGGRRNRVEGFETERLGVWQIGDAAAPRPWTPAAMKAS